MRWTAMLWVMIAGGCGLDRVQRIHYGDTEATPGGEATGTSGSSIGPGTGAFSDGEGEGTSGGDPSRGSTGDPSSPPEPRAVLFNDPSTATGQDTTLEDAVIALIDDAVPGSSIRVALYQLSRQSVAEALVAAKSRGVDVRVVIDNNNGYQPGSPQCPGDEPCPWAAITFLRQYLDEDELVECNADLYGVPPYADGQPGCIGDVIHQNKFVLFSELEDGSRDVVVQSSGDLSFGALCQHNDLVILRDDVALFEAYANYWDDLAAQQLEPNYHWTARGDTDALAVAFFPRGDLEPDDPEDDVLELLDQVVCDEGASIRLAHAYWTALRAGVAAKLAALSQDGCEVRIILAERAGNIDPSDYGLETAVFPAGQACSASSDLDLQHKLMLIDAPIGPDGAWQRIVMTGSHNLTNNALRHNDETLLRITDDALFEAYASYWDRLWAALR